MLWAVEAEQAVLGSVLIDSPYLHRVAQVLREDDFSSELNRQIYRVLLAMDKEGKPIDGLTTAAVLRAERIGNDQEMRRYLADLMNITPTSANVMEYAQIVLERSKRRKLKEALTLAQEQLESGEGEDVILPALEAAVTDVNGRAASELMAPGDQVDAFYQMRERIDDGEKPYTRTGFRELDKYLSGGLQNGGLYFLAARPAVGKTALALFIAEWVAQNIGTVLFFSMEMTSNQVMARRVASLAKVNSKHILADTLTEKEYEAVAEATTKIAKSRMYLTDGNTYTADRISAIARSRKDIRLVIVDHFSLLQVSGRQRNDIEYANAAHTLKRLAMTLDAPVLCLAQLNRENEQRNNKRPRMSDMRETGASEQDADGVILLHRPDYYDERPKEVAAMPSLMDVIVAKNRHGDTGTVTLSFYKQTNTFRETFVK